MLQYKDILFVYIFNSCSSAIPGDGTGLSSKQGVVLVSTGLLKMEKLSVAGTTLKVQQKYKR